LSIAEQRAVGFIPAWSLAFLQRTNQENPNKRTRSNKKVEEKG